MPILDNVVYSHLRLQVVSAASQRILEGKPGMQCVGFPAAHGSPALVVVWDEGVLNEGASATNSIESVLKHLRDRWAGVIPVEEALVVERDSAGDFDHAYPDWNGDVALMLGRLPRIRWKPMTWPGAAPRSIGAFEGVFGERARVAVEVIRSASV